MKAVLYARISTTEQQSIEAQLSILREYCQRAGWEVAREFQEIVSGAKRQRPERDELMKLARRRQMKVVVVWKLDRWGRSITDIVNTLEEMESYGVSFVSVTEAIDMTTAQGRLMRTILGGVAEFEHDIIKERIRLGVADYRSKHSDWGRPKSKAWKQAAAIMKARQTGKSIRAISAELGLPIASVFRIIKTSRHNNP